MDLKNPPSYDYNLTIIIPSLMSETALEFAITFFSNLTTIPSGLEFIYVGPSGSANNHHFEDRILNLVSGKKPPCRFFYGGSSVYEAMNIGLKNCNSRFVYFCGDTDLPFLDELMGAINQYLSISRLQLPVVITGAIRRGARKIIARMPPLAHIRLALERNPSHHQGLIYDIRVFNLAGLYPTSYRILGDYCFNLKLRYLAHLPTPELNIYPTSTFFCDFAEGGLSGSARLLGYIESFRCKQLFLPYWLYLLALFIELLAYCLRFTSVFFRRIVRK